MQDPILAKYVAEANKPELPNVDGRDHHECTPFHVALLHGALCWGGSNALRLKYSHFHLCTLGRW